MLPTNNSYYSSTSNPHSRSHRRLRVRDNRQGAGGETPLSETRRGGIRRAAVQSPAIAVTRRSRARPPPLGPRLGPRRHRYRPPLLPPALSLVQPALYLPVSILVLLTPSRNSASLPVPPPHLPPTATTTPMTSEASTPQWTRRRKTTGRGPPSPRRRCPHCPQWGGGGAEHSALSLPGSRSRSVRYLRTIIPPPRTVARYAAAPTMGT